MIRGNIRDKGNGGNGMEWCGISCVVISLNICRKWWNIFKIFKIPRVDDSKYLKVYIAIFKLGKLEFFFSKLQDNMQY